MKRREFVRTALTAGLASNAPLCVAAVSAGAASLAPSASGPGGRGSGRKPRLMYYDDSRHSSIYIYEPPMLKEEFEASVDDLVGTPVDALMFGLGDGRTVLHDTKVGELWGDPVKEWTHMVFRRAHQNARMMLDSGGDPLRIVCERARAKGLAIFPSLFLNRGRGKDRRGDVRSANFTWENQHLEIGARGDLDESFPGLRKLDFKHQEVRDERFALIQEVLQNYPVDGFELHFGHYHYLHPKEVDAGRDLMTAWVKRIHDALKASGSNRELAVRVPVSLEEANSRGLDVREWVDRGIVEVVIGESYSYRMDQLADFRPMVEAAQNRDCRVHAVIQPEVHSDRLDNGTIEFIRAVACNYWAQGIDGLYLSQWFTAYPYRAEFYAQLREMSHPDIMTAKDKFYYVPTKQGATGPEMPLPRPLKVNQPVKTQLAVSDDLPRWDKMGRVHEVMLRFRLSGATETDRLEFRFNGKKLPKSSLRKINRVYRMRAPRYRVFGYWFIFRLPRDHWPMQGKNKVEVTLLHRDGDIIPDLALKDVEMEVKYLDGKNFARGQDLDTGPYRVWKT